MKIVSTLNYIFMIVNLTLGFINYETNHFKSAAFSFCVSAWMFAFFIYDYLEINDNLRTKLLRYLKIPIIITWVAGIILFYIKYYIISYILLIIFGFSISFLLNLHFKK